MQFLRLLSLTFVLVSQDIIQNPCLASDSEDEDKASSSEPAKKRQRTHSALLEKPLLEDNESNTLPDEIWMHIFDLLSFRDLGRAQQVCHPWYTLGQDEWLCLSKQIEIKPLSILWEKLKGSPNKHYQQFFSSPLALEKICSDPTVLKKILKTPFLLPLFFQSKITALRIYQALNELAAKQQSALEAYVRTAPIFPSDKSLFSQDFLAFAKTNTVLYKALYLLALFNVSSGELIKNLFRRVNQEIEVRDIYTDKKEEEAILLPQAMTNFFNIPRKKAYNIAKYCENWAQQSANRDQWLRLAEAFNWDAASQGHGNALLNLSFLLDDRGEHNTAADVWLILASQGDLVSQATLGLHYAYQGENEVSEFYFRGAADQGDAESQYHLGCLLEDQGRLEEAEECYYQSAEQEYSPAQHKVGLCLEKKGHFLGALNNYEKSSNQGYKLAYLSLAFLLEQHPELFIGTQEEWLKKIVHLREQGKEKFKE